MQTNSTVTRLPNVPHGTNSLRSARAPARELPASGWLNCIWSAFQCCAVIRPKPDGDARCEQSSEHASDLRRAHSEDETLRGHGPHGVNLRARTVIEVPCDAGGQGLAHGAESPPRSPSFEASPREVKTRSPESAAPAEGESTIAHELEVMRLAASLTSRIESVMRGPHSEVKKRRQLSVLLDQVTDREELVALMARNVLTSRQFSDRQKVFFVAHLARENPGCLKRPALLAITQSLRRSHHEWRDTISYGQVFAYLYAGSAAHLTSRDLSLEKQALLSAKFPLARSWNFPQFKAWALAQLDELIRLKPD